MTIEEMSTGLIEMITNKLKTEKETEMNEKIDRMLEEYSAVYAKVEQMFLDEEVTLEPKDIAAKTDMFWNIAKQEMQREEMQKMQEQQIKARGTEPVKPSGCGKGK